MTPTARLLIMTNVTSVTKNENLIHEVVYKIQENISNDVSLLKNKHVAEKCCTAAGFLPCTVLFPGFLFFALVQSVWDLMKTKQKQSVS